MRHQILTAGRIKKKKEREREDNLCRINSHLPEKIDIVNLKDENF